MVSFVSRITLGIFHVPHICRETSNKALNAINDIHLVPFLMSFLGAREKLAVAPVMAAGVSSFENLVISGQLILFSSMSICSNGR